MKKCVHNLIANRKHMPWFIKRCTRCKMYFEYEPRMFGAGSFKEVEFK